MSINTTQREAIAQQTVDTVRTFDNNFANFLIPLRLFLGISFVAAALDKLTDPQFFDVQASGYIGNQLAGFARQSPLGGFLTSVAVPNATLFGGMVVAGELAIGLGTLVGLFSRVAAIFGFILSMTLWLTSSWSVSPFFLGSDLPYAMGWLTLALAGANVVWSLDGILLNYWRTSGARTASMQPQATANGAVLSQVSTLLQPVEARQVARRQFIAVTGATVLAGAVTGVAWLNGLNNKSSDAPTGTANPVPTPPVVGQSGTASALPVSGSSKGKVLASLSSLAIGDVQPFTTPDSHESGLLIRQADGSVKAFSTVCTHQGCDVGFVKAQQKLACPCHGAEFDIATGEPTRPPARRALKSYKVEIDGGNIVYIQS